MRPRREFCLGFVLLLASLGLEANAAGRPRGEAKPQEPYGTEPALQRGTLTVWVPKSHVMGLMSAPTTRLGSDYPWAVLLNEFKSDFPNFDLRCKILDRDEFVQALHSSQQDQPYPDVAFVDNYRELGPLIDENAVVKMWGRPRFAYNGWWVIFRQAKNFEAGKDFVLWLSQSPQWKPWRISTASVSLADTAAVQAISKEAVQDFAGADPQSLASIMDPDAGRFDDFGPDGAQTLRSVEPLSTFGNSRLAFVLLAEIGQGEETFGMAHSAVVLRNVGDRWKVLLILPSEALPALEDLLKSFDAIGLEEGQPESVPKITLLAPADQARLLRFPRPELEWASVGGHLAAYVIESQYNQPGREYWSSSRIKVVSPIPGESSLRMMMPFGIGHQPHRWRIWAISRSGTLSMSNWRVIDYTN